MEMVSITWLAIFILLVIVELLTMGLTTIWFAGGAVVAFIASLLNANMFVQVLLFFAVSILLLIFTRPFASKYVNRNKVLTNVDGLVGKRAVVMQDIDNLQMTGEVQIEGKVWMARTSEDGVHIAKDAIVTIESIRGVKLIVKEERKQEEV